MRTEFRESRCATCGASFEFDALRFELPPLTCRSCFRERAARLVKTTGRVVQVRNVGALLETADSRRFFWCWSGRRTTRPMLGERYVLKFDPLEKPAPPRLPVARAVAGPLPEAG